MIKPYVQGVVVNPMNHIRSQALVMQPRYGSGPYVVYHQRTRPKKLVVEVLSRGPSVPNNHALGS